MNVTESDSYNLADNFVDRNLREGRGDKTAIIFGNRSITYAEVAADVSRVGNALLSLGLQEEQRVLLLLPDCPEFAAAYFGVIKIGAVAVPTSTALRATDYDYFLAESRARVLIVHSALFSEVLPILSKQRSLRRVIIVGEPQAGCLEWDKWLGESSDKLDAALTSKYDVAFWLWTSGSTGRPKAAVHLHHDWIFCCRNYASKVLQVSREDVTFSSSKLFHAYGLGNGLMFPFHAGATTVFYPGKAQAKTTLETAQATRPRCFTSISRRARGASGPAAPVKPCRAMSSAFSMRTARRRRRESSGICLSP